MEKTKIIVLLGSSRYCQEMAVCAWLLEKQENAITMGLHLLPYWYPADSDHQAEKEGVAEQMDNLHLRKIDLADEIFVVNKDDYIGDSTRREIQYSESKGLTDAIRWYTHDDIGEEVEKILKDYYQKRFKKE